MKKRYKHFDMQWGILHLDACYDIAAADRTHVIILLPFNMNIINKLKNYALILCQYALKE